MRGPDGELLGILSVDEPISGRRPSGDEIDVLVAVSEHAALAVQAAQEGARAKANRDALERLLAVSTTLNETSDTSNLLAQVCAAISEALGFEKVAVQLLSDDGVHRTVAQVGFADGENIGVAAHRRRARAAAPARVRCRGLLRHPARGGARGAPRPARRATTRSATAAARTRGRTTGCSSRCTTGAAGASATSGPTTRPTGCGPTPSG